MAGIRGIISEFCPGRYALLPDGTSVDIAQPWGAVMNVNVGQVFECLLVGQDNLGLRFKLTPFDEIYVRSSRTLVHDKLWKRGGNWQGVAI